MHNKFFFLFFFFFTADYVKKCKLGDPKLSECLKATVEDVIRKFANGK